MQSTSCSTAGTRQSRLFPLLTVDCGSYTATTTHATCFLQVPVVTLLHALPQLVDVGILCGFALLIFGIVGVQMFAGVMQNRQDSRCDSASHKQLFILTLCSFASFLVIW